jgi:hypothetical protein
MRSNILCTILILLAYAGCNSSKPQNEDADIQTPANIIKPSGAYRLDVETTTFVRVYEGNYFSETAYASDGGNFLSTYGGTWLLDSSNYTEDIEFHSKDSTKVGLTETHQLLMDEGGLSIDGNSFTAIDDAITTPLKGAWFIAGREQDGEMQFREPSPRKTMKILSGTRFQWVAYDVAKKDFYGTGGGTYTSDNGQYIETIEFFSRDSTRVGASLDFGFEVQGNDWHHKGLSSKGDSIYEVWRR